MMIFLGAWTLAAPVWAFDATDSYVQAQILAPQLLPPPPDEGSAAWRAQVDQVVKAQRGLSAGDLTDIRDEQKMRVEVMTGVMGGDFTRERLPKTFAMLDRVLGSVSQVSEADKKFWNTRRPYLTDARVKLYVDPIDSSPSYPSGHTTGSRVLAEVLGMLAPEKLDALRARADMIALHRVEAGVHYPADVEGGQMLAMLIVGAMLADDDFQDDLAAARKEMVGG